MSIMQGVEPISWTAATGQASFGEIVGATWDSYIYLSNLDARANARELYVRSYSDRLRAQGIEIDAPDLGLPGRENDPAARAGSLGVSLLGSGLGAVATAAALIQGQGEETALTAWRDQVASALADKPDVIEAMGGLPDIDAGTRRVMREAEERLSAYTATQDTATSLAAQFTGGMAGTLADPVQGPLTVATSLWGVGASAGRAIWSTIARAAVREATVNAAAEATAQPFVQANRQYAGLDYGFGRALSDIGFAAVIGGGLGAGFEAVGRGVRRVVSGPSLTGRTTPPPSVVRGAVNAMETDMALTTARPVGVSASAHTAALDAGARAAADPSQMRQAASAVGLALDDGGGVLETGAVRAAPDGTAATVDVLTLADGQRYVRETGAADWKPDAPDATARDVADAVDAESRMGAPDNAPRTSDPVAQPRAASLRDEVLRSMTDEQLGAFREKVAKQAETQPAAQARLQAVDAEAARRDGGEGFTKVGRVRGVRRAMPSDNVLDFIADRGGLKPHPDLAMIDAGAALRPGRGRIVGPGGRLDLDAMRELVAEAGYFGGDTAEAIARTTPADLIDLIDDALRGKGGFAPFTADAQARHFDAVAEREREAELDRLTGEIRAAMQAEGLDDAKWLARAVDVADESGLGSGLTDSQIMDLLERAAITLVPANKRKVVANDVPFPDFPEPAPRGAASRGQEAGDGGGGGQRGAVPGAGRNEGQAREGRKEALAPGEATGFLNSRAATIDEYRARSAKPRPAMESVADGLGDMPPFEESEMAAQIADLESMYPDPEAIEMPDGSTLADHLAEADRGRRMASIVSACGLG